ncbi:MAG: hypothetical protein KJ749_12490, partial [Planctomycetes bacterium]|nr:hypothetical protein [Planctomycetota bacterium]
MTQAVVIRGVSDAARYIEDVTRHNRRYLHESSAFGIESVLRDELAEAWAECQESDWDGHDAQPVSHDALRNMYAFLEALPLGFPRPAIGADPHGHLSVEWYRSSRRVLSVGVSPDEVLHYAALLGSSRTCGTDTFFGEIPENILNL